MMVALYSAKKGASISSILHKVHQAGIKLVLIRIENMLLNGRTASVALCVIMKFEPIPYV